MQQPDGVGMGSASVGVTSDINTGFDASPGGAAGGAKPPLKPFREVQKQAAAERARVGGTGTGTGALHGTAVPAGPMTRPIDALHGTAGPVATPGGSASTGGSGRRGSGSVTATRNRKYSGVSMGSDRSTGTGTGVAAGDASQGGAQTARVLSGRPMSTAAAGTGGGGGSLAGALHGGALASPAAPKAGGWKAAAMAASKKPAPVATAATLVRPKPRPKAKGVTGGSDASGSRGGDGDGDGGGMPGSGSPGDNARLLNLVGRGGLYLSPDHVPQLEEYFGQFGPIVRVWVHDQRMFGLVEYEHGDSVVKAVGSKAAEGGGGGPEAGAGAAAAGMGRSMEAKFRIKGLPGVVVCKGWNPANKFRHHKW